MSRDDLQTALLRVRVAAPLAWSWGWEIREDFPHGFHVRVTFERPDRETGIMGRGAGRWLLVPANATAHDIAGTAFVAIKLIVEHELLEGFHFDGRRIFDPHGPR